MRSSKRKLEAKLGKLIILAVVVLFCLFPQAGGASITVTNPSFESGSTGWSGNISTGNSEYYSPVDGTHYATDPDVIGKTTAELQTESTFTSAGWDFVDIWEFRCEGMNYPRLIWQTTNLPDYLCPDGVGFEDYAVFAQQWPNTACGDCSGADLTGDGNVDYYDLQLFVEQWLQNP